MKIVYVIIAGIFMYLGTSDDAKEYFIRKYIQYVKPDNPVTANALYTDFLVTVSKREHDSAIESGMELIYYVRDLDSISLIDKRDIIVDVLKTIAGIHMERKNYQEAEQMFGSSLATMMKIGGSIHSVENDNALIINLLLGLSKSREAQGKDHEKYLEKARERGWRGQ